MRLLEVAALLAVTAAVADAAQHGHDTGAHAHDQHAAGVHAAPAAPAASCDLGIRLTDAAERRSGGARHKPAGEHEQLAEGQGVEAPAHADHGADAVPAKAHTIHEPQFGGSQFFMAPNKLHHIEPVYSEHCGLRVIVYNAHSEPIRADRFRAFVRVIPSNQKEAEQLRFLEVSADGTVLEAMFGPGLTPPFEAELYVRFPRSDDPELFNVLISN